MKRLVALLGLLLAAGCGGEKEKTPAATTTTVERHNISGSMELTDKDGIMEAPDGGCQGTGGYDDIRLGTDVVVSDPSNRVIGTSRLGEGNWTGDHCIFRFVVSNLPRFDFYKVEVSHRGQLTYSYQDLVSNNWAVEAELG
jgi:hypothetical protein